MRCICVRCPLALPWFALLLFPGRSGCGRLVKRVGWNGRGSLRVAALPFVFIAVSTWQTLRRKPRRLRKRSERHPERLRQTLRMRIVAFVSFTAMRLRVLGSRMRSTKPALVLAVAAALLSVPVAQATPPTIVPAPSLDFV
jgi:hypothetical protein